MAALTSRGRKTLNITIAFLILAVAVTVCRFIAVAKRKHGAVVHDYLALASLAVFIAYCGVLFKAVTAVGSLDYLEIAPSNLNVVQPYIFAEQIICGFVITLAKLSLLFFYRMIFVNKRFRMINTIIIVAALAWFIGTLLLVILQCNPVSYGWDAVGKLTHPGTCIGSGNLVLGYEVSNIFVDLLMLALPIHQVLRLQMTPLRKFGVVFLFAFGGFIIITSALRAYYTWAVNWDASHVADSLDWTTVQLSCAVMVASLPMAPKFIPTWIEERYNTLATWASSRIRRSSSDLQGSNGQPRTPNSKTQRYPAPQLRKDGGSSKVYADSSERSSSPEDVALHEIRVQRDVDVHLEEGTMHQK